MASPTVKVTATDLKAWESFFGDKDVKVIVELDPTADSSITPSTPLKCTNNFFWGWKFASTANKDALRIGKPVAGFENSTLLRLSEKPEDLGDSKHMKTVADLLLIAVVDTSDPGDDEDDTEHTPPVDEELAETPEQSGAIETPQNTEQPNLFKIIASSITEGVSFKIDKTEDRNAMWITSGNTIRVDTSLTFIPVIEKSQTAYLQTIQQAISNLLKINFEGLSLKSFTVKRTSRGSKITEFDDHDNAVVSYHVTTTTSLTFQISLGSFILWVGLESNGVKVAVTPQSGYSPSDGAIQTILPSSLEMETLKPPTDIFNSIRFLKLQLGLNLTSGFTWGVTFAVTLKGAEKDEDALEMYIDYESWTKTLSGGLIFDGFYATPENYFHPDYDPFSGIELAAGAKPPPPYWDLRQYFPDPDSVPNNLPLAIADASTSIMLGDEPVFGMSGSLVAPTGAVAASPAEVIPSPFLWDELSFSFTISKSNLELAASTTFILNPPPSTNYASAELSILAAYSKNSGWLLHGHVEDLSCGLLYSFFEDSSKNDLLGVLGDLKIANLDLLFTYDSTGSAASFLISGAVQLRELDLRVFYQYTSTKAGDNTAVAKALVDKGYVNDDDTPKLLKPPKTSKTAWVFECDLGASNENATIGSVADAFVADAADSLPSFVADIKIPKADGSNGKAPFYLKTMKDSKGKILFVLRFAIGIFSLTFVQVGSGSKPKRLVRFSADILPTKDGIPLIDKLPQPFEQLDYVWVNDAGGFHISDVDSLNNAGILGSDLLLYKVDTKTGPSKDVPPRPDGSSSLGAQSNPDPVVIAPGHHFVILGGGRVLLDHNFSASPSPKTWLLNTSKASAGPDTIDPGTTDFDMIEPDTPVVDAPAAPSNQVVTPVQSSPPTKGSIGFNQGPLSITAMGLQFKEEGGKQCLVLTFDATFVIGPLTFSLLGFGLTVNLKGLTLDNLQNAFANTEVTLHGLSLAFNKPPILMAGGFQHEIIQSLGVTQEVYLGGVAVSFPPYTFSGLGEYAIVKDKTGEYKSVFVFAKLDGPLIQLELATISGVRLGFGFNSFVRSPRIDELTDFPFVNDRSISTTGNEPMAILKKMTMTNPPWVTPKLDSYWLAAGMSIKAFDVLTATAVAVFEFGDAGLAVGIYADAVAQMPPEAPIEATVVYVEVGMKIELNFVDGYFAVAAMLAPTSFLLVPQCRLTGGMALSYWFPPNENAGDWVFTVGGYHRSYTPPAHYPVVPRMGISFQVGIISITGQSYFAITPKCVMAGALIHASLSFGPIEAWLDAAFDCLINFHPFHYDVQFRISVGVSFNLDLLFVQIYISVMIGADLHIQGPEFGGTARIDFYLFAFDVSFGAPVLPPPPLDLLQFWLSLHKPGPSGDSQVHESHVMSGWKINFAPQEQVGNSTSGAAFKYILEDGNFPRPKQDAQASGEPENTGAGANWYVKGGSFKFRVGTDFAMSNATIARSTETIDSLKEAAKAAGQDPETVKGVEDLKPSPSKIYAKPMHVGPSGSASNKIQSSLAIVIKEKNSGKVVDGWRSAELIIKEVPTAVWAPYDPNSDPRTRPADLLHGDNPTTPQAMALAIGSPLPELCPPPNWPGFIPKFKATAAAKFGILDFRMDHDNGTAWFIPKSEPTQTQYLAKPQTDVEKKQTNQEAWDSMEDTWSGLADKDDLVNEANGLAGMFAATLGWDKAAASSPVVSQSPPADSTSTPDQSSPRPSWRLVGSLPSKLIKNLEQTYLSLPRIAVVSA